MTNTILLLMSIMIIEAPPVPVPHESDVVTSTGDNSPNIVGNTGTITLPDATFTGGCKWVFDGDGTRKLVLNFCGGRLTVEGDMPYDEAAKRFLDAIGAEYKSRARSAHSTGSYRKTAVDCGPGHEHRCYACNGEMIGCVCVDAGVE